MLSEIHAWKTGREGVVNNLSRLCIEPSWLGLYSACLGDLFFLIQQAALLPVRLKKKKFIKAARGMQLMICQGLRAAESLKPDDVMIRVSMVR